MRLGRSNSNTFKHGARGRGEKKRSRSTGGSVITARSPLKKAIRSPSDFCLRNLKGGERQRSKVRLKPDREWEERISKWQVEPLKGETERPRPPLARRACNTVRYRLPSVNRARTPTEENWKSCVICCTGIAHQRAREAVDGMVGSISLVSLQHSPSKPSKSQSSMASNGWEWKELHYILCKDKLQSSIVACIVLKGRRRRKQQYIRYRPLIFRPSGEGTKRLVHSQIAIITRHALARS